MTYTVQMLQNNITLDNGIDQSAFHEGIETDHIIYKKLDSFFDALIDVINTDESDRILIMDRDSLPEEAKLWAGHLDTNENEASTPFLIARDKGPSGSGGPMVATSEDMIFFRKFW